METVSSFAVSKLHSVLCPDCTELKGKYTRIVSFLITRPSHARAGMNYCSDRSARQNYFLQSHDHSLRITFKLPISTDKNNK